MDKYSTVQITASEITLGNAEPNNKQQINEYDDFLCSSLKNSKANGLQEVAIANNANSKDFKVNSLLCRGCTAGFKRVLEMLDTVGSSITNLNSSQGFGSENAAKTELAILSFEVANTIVKGSNLMRSLSKENIKYSKEIVLPSEGIQRLVSIHMDALLRIAAADKREDLKVFIDEVVRFGNHLHYLQGFEERNFSSAATKASRRGEDFEGMKLSLVWNCCDHLCYDYTFIKKNMLSYNSTRFRPFVGF